MRNTKIINLFSGPGSGKSTTAAGLFSLLKLRKVECELVLEYAKELTWEGNTKQLEDQLFITAEQNKRMKRLIGKVDFVITDSPILLGCIYSKGHELEKELGNLIRQLYNQYNNLNFFIRRVKEFNPNGRNQNETQAKGIDEEIKNLLYNFDNMFLSFIDGDELAPRNIIKNLELSDQLCSK